MQKYPKKTTIVHHVRPWIRASLVTPAPPLISTRLQATVSRHPRGNIAKVTVPPGQRTWDTEENIHTWRAYDPQNEWKIVCWGVCSGLLRDKHCVPLFEAQAFHFEQLHMLNKGPWNGISSCRFGCHLGGRFCMIQWTGCKKFHLHNKGFGQGGGGGTKEKKLPDSSTSGPQQCTNWSVSPSVTPQPAPVNHRLPPVQIQPLWVDSNPATQHLRLSSVKG